MKKWLYISLLMLIGVNMSAQDSQFTQFYAAPTYLNPAFAGTSVQNRIIANYRNQWPAIPGGFQSYAFSYDHYAPQINSGFGLLATHEKAGSGALRATNIAVQYAYEIRIRRDVFFLPALQFGYSTRNINFSNLVFSDQLIRDNAETTLETANFEPVNFLDVGTGFLLFSTKYWLGGSVHHLNQPNESLFPQVVSLIDRKYSLHGGYRFRLNGKFYNRSKNYLVTAFNFKSQGTFSQLDLGAYVELNPMTFGIWYRGLPPSGNGFGDINQDAVAVLVGFQSGSYKIGYSYDLTISTLSLGVSSGSHEISFIYDWANKRNIRLAKRRIIPCAKF